MWPKATISAVPHVARPAGGARRRDPTGRAPEHRLQDDPAAGGQRHAVRPDGAGGQRADDLVARHERKGDDVFEVARAAPVQGREVGPADAGEDRVDVDPALGRGLGRSPLDQAERTDAGAASRSEGRHHPRRGEARQRPFEQEGAHAVTGSPAHRLTVLTGP